MAIYSIKAVQANLRVRDGKRVFYLGDQDRLTPSARDYLRQEGIAVLPAKLAKVDAYKTPEGETLSMKPEQMTHLQPDVLVPKTHPRIVFRGELDSLQAEILLCGSLASGALAKGLEEMLDYARWIMRCDVLGERLPEKHLCGLSPDELRAHSHFPQKYYDQPHFMPAFSDDPMILRLNRLRTMVRRTEIAACRAFSDRDDLIRALNRMSSLVWIWMIRLKKEGPYGK